MSHLKFLTADLHWLCHQQLNQCTVQSPARQWAHSRPLFLLPPSLIIISRTAAPPVVSFLYSKCARLKLLWVCVKSAKISDCRHMGQGCLFNRHSCLVYQWVSDTVKQQVYYGKVHIENSLNRFSVGRTATNPHVKAKNRYLEPFHLNCFCWKSNVGWWKFHMNIYPCSMHHNLPMLLMSSMHRSVTSHFVHFFRAIPSGSNE